MSGHLFEGKLPEKDRFSVAALKRRWLLEYNEFEMWCAAVRRAVGMSGVSRAEHPQVEGLVQAHRRCTTSTFRRCHLLLNIWPDTTTNSKPTPWPCPHLCTASIRCPRPRPPSPSQAVCSWAVEALLRAREVTIQVVTMT